MTTNPETQDEQVVLGAMLLSKTAITDVINVLHSHDFHRAAHQLIFNRILDLHGRGEPADPITVIPELYRRGELHQVGGAPYLHTLISTVPSATDAKHYADRVAKTNRRRSV